MQTCRRSCQTPATPTSRCDDTCRCESRRSTGLEIRCHAESFSKSYPKSLAQPLLHSSSIWTEVRSANFGMCLCSTIDDLCAVCVSKLLQPHVQSAVAFQVQDFGTYETRVWTRVRHSWRCICKWQQSFARVSALQTLTDVQQSITDSEIPPVDV